MIGQTISHFRILEKLGEGGMGVVYKAEDTQLKRTVALKFLPRGLEAHEPERARFLQEAQAASAINHPNVCTIYEISQYEGPAYADPSAGRQQFIVMEYVDGKTLRQMVPIQKTQVAIDYAIQIGDALQEAHSKGIVHRDVKTDNIMVNTKNQIKVMDFGLAKLKGSMKLTKTSSTVGTLAYMAPEQIQGGEVDARSDIFSFGVVLYEMLTGHMPFRGEHEAAMVYSIVNEEPDSLQKYLSDAPSELVHVLDRALEKDPEERYQTVHEMLIDLRRLKKVTSRVSRQAQSEMPIPGVAVQATAVERKNKWRKRLWIGAAGIVALCVLSIILLLPRTHPARLNANRTSVTLRIPFKETQYPALSGDGKWIAFPAKDENGKWDVYWMNTSGTKPNRVTDERALFITTCDISPDLSRIAYDCLSDERDWIPKVKLVATEGGGTRTLADTGYCPKWSPDGQRIGYMRGQSLGAPSHSGKLEIWSIRSDGTDNRLEFIDTVTNRVPSAFSWSSDGASIAWVRNYPEGYGEVMVRELATGKERQLTSDRKTVDEVIWGTNGEVLFASNKSGPTNLWMIPAGGGEATQVTQGGVPIRGARISADCKTLVYFQLERTDHIWISSIDGSNARQVTFDDAQVFSASFSPEGKYIAYVFVDVDELSPEAHLIVIDHDGKNRRQLTSGSKKVTACSWSPDGKWLAYSSREVGEPQDSDRVYLIQPINPSAPRLLCTGRLRGWLDSENLIVGRHMKSLQYSTKGGTETQVYRDSTMAFPIQGNKQLLFFDARKGREGFWTVLVDSLGRNKGEAKQILPIADLFGGLALSLDRRIMIYRKPDGDVLWRMWTSSAKEERIGKALPRGASVADLRADGKELLWVWEENRSKLVLVKNVFE